MCIFHEKVFDANSNLGSFHKQHKSLKYIPLEIYSKTCFERPPKVSTKIGRKRQVTSQKRSKTFMEFHKRLTSKRFPYKAGGRPK